MQMVLRGTLRVVLAVFVFFSLVFPQPVHAQEGEILISTPAELELIRSNLAGSYRLVADIDLSAYSNWVPLGQVDNTTTPFTGSLIGDGHAIRNLVLANTQVNNQGLFGIIGPGAQVSSLRIENARVTAANSAGILAGTNQGAVTGVSTEGIISGGTVVGGLVGTNTGTITQSFAIAAVSGLDQNGGLVGSNTGTISYTYSASSVSAAVTNNYIQFDGTDDYISIPHRDEYITDSFTLEAWFQWGDTGTSVTSFIIGKGLENFEIHTGGGSYENGIRFIPVLRSMTEYNDARAYQDVYQVLKPGWNHVAATWDYAHEQVRVSVNGVPQPIYQNGVNVGTEPSLPIPDAIGNPLAGNTKHFFIGARNDRNNALDVDEYPFFFFKGNISDVRFWNIVRTPEQIAADKYKQLTGDEPGLMGYWKLDETSGDTVIDSSYLHNNGTLLGNAVRRQVLSSNGGLVAVNTAPGTVTNSYYDSTVAGAGVTENGYGTPLTTAQMKSSGSYIGWVFPGTWKILEDRTYPTLFTYPAPIDITSIAPSPASSGNPYTVNVAASHYLGALANPVSVADGDGHNCSITIPAVSPYTGSCQLTPTNQGSATVTASYAGDAVFTSGSDTQALTVNDGIAPSVTVNQAGGQADPASSSPVHFTAVFSEPIDLATFTAEDVTISGTAGANAASIAQIAPNDGTTFDISVTGMNTPGTVIAAIGAGLVQDLAGNVNTASTDTDNQVTSTIDLTPPSVTVNQATGQDDPTGTSPIHFTATFSEPIDLASFSAADVTLSGTAGASAVTITEMAPNNGATFDLAVTGMLTPGTVVASIGAGKVQDPAGNSNTASTATDNQVTSTIDLTGPTVTVNQAAGQADPTTTSPLHFTAVFSEPIDAASFGALDLSLTGTAGATTAVITQVAPNDGTTFDVAVSGMSGPGTVIASIGAGLVQDLAGNGNAASTATDNQVTFQVDPPVVNGFTAADRSASLEVAITAFSVLNPTYVNGYRVTLSNTSPGAGEAGWSVSVPTSYTLPGEGTYTLYPWAKDVAGNVSALYGSPVAVIVDLTPPDTLFIDVPPSSINSSSATFTFVGTDGSGSGSAAYECKIDTAAFSACSSPLTLTALSDGQHTISVRAIDGVGLVDPTPISCTWTVDTTGPSVTVNQASGQLDPTGDTPIHFTAVFNEPIDEASFLAGDVTISGTAGATTASITEVDPNDGATFDIAVTGMSTPGTVIVSIAAGQVADPVGNLNLASTATDNVVTSTIDHAAPSVTVNQAAGQADPTGASPIHFTAVFSEPINISTFTDGDVTLAGTAGANAVAVTQIAPNDGTTFDLAVSGMDTPGTVIASIDAGTVQDLAGNSNTASTSTDHQVSSTIDLTPPSVTINQAAGQDDEVASGPVHFTAVFNEPILPSSFTPDDVTLGGTAGATTVAIAELAPFNGTTFDVIVSGMNTPGTVTVAIPLGKVQDLAGNTSTGSTSTDNEVVSTLDQLGPAVTVNQAAGQADPTDIAPLRFTVIFNEPINVSSFTADDISMVGSAGANVATITQIAPNNGTTFEVLVSGMSGSGLVIVSIGAGHVQDLAGNLNSGSTSTDNQVTFSNQIPTNVSLVVTKYQPSMLLEAWTVTVTVSSGQGVPTGSVTLKNGAHVLETSPLVDGRAAFTVSSLPGGSNAITAEYNGQGDYTSSASDAVEIIAKYYQILFPIYRGTN